MIQESKAAETNDEALGKFETFRSLDPFPSIPPALLNSADFVDYIQATGMIYPFDSSNTKPIKSASLELEIADEILYWDENGKKIYNSRLPKNETIVFRKNSITFVTVNAMFRLPDYIALRFNLQIHHVHRGLLLGTGPLVDPGFQGRLMIPIHNLTENNYEINLGEGLICVEFTKLSPNTSWGDSSTDLFSRKGKFVQNVGKKDNKSFLELVKMHVPQQKIRSSLDSTLVAMQEVTDTARAEIRKFDTKIQIASIVSVVVLAAFVIQTWSLISDANKFVSDAKNTYMEQLNNPSNSIILDIYKSDFESIKSSLKKDYEAKSAVDNRRLEAFYRAIEGIKEKQIELNIKHEEKIKILESELEKLRLEATTVTN